MPLSVVSPLTRQVANAIAEACADRKVQPSHLRWGELKRWLKESKGFEATELRQVEAHVASVGGFTNLRNAFFIASATPQNIEAAEMKLEAKLGRASVNALVSDEVFLRRWEEATRAVLSKNAHYKPFGYAIKPSKEKTLRVDTVALSDLHFGSRLDPRELKVRYDFTEESRRLASVLDRVVRFKLDYRDVTELVIWLGGDLICGKIHDKQNSRAISEQLCDAMWLLTQFVEAAAGHYKHVHVYCTSGNHDREEGRHEKPAHDAKWDSRATGVYFAIKLAVRHFKNVEVHIPRTPYNEYAPFNRRIYATHGDTNFQTGNVAKGVDIDRLVKQMNTINLAEMQSRHAPYEAFLAGHIHQGVHVPLPVAELVTNPALLPADGYSQSIGYLNSKTGSVLFESTQDHVVGDLRFLFVDNSVHDDAALDRLIQPFCDF